MPTTWLALAALPLLAGVAGVVDPPTALAAGTALVAGAALQSSLRLGARRREQRLADQLILAGDRLPAELAWRERELTDPAQRLSLAKSIRSLVRSLGREVVLTSQVVNRPAARAQRARLTALADRLELVEQPVQPRGVLLTLLLLRDGTGPLYDRTRVDELPEHLDLALRALEPRS